MLIYLYIVPVHSYVLREYLSVHANYFFCEYPASTFFFHNPETDGDDMFSTPIQIQACTILLYQYYLYLVGNLAIFGPKLEQFFELSRGQNQLLSPAKIRKSKKSGRTWGGATAV